MSASQLAVVDVTVECYRFLLETEAAIIRGRNRLLDEARERWKRRAVELLARVSEAREHAAERFSIRLDEAAIALRTFAGELSRGRPEASRLASAWRALGRSYEGLRARIRQLRLPVPDDVDLRQLRPRNLARNAFHVSMGLTGVLVYELLLDRTGTLWVAGVLLAAFVGLDVARRVSTRFNTYLVEGAFGRISRPGEAHQVPAATWYMLALFLGVWWLPQHAIELGTLALGVGDPAASLAGKRWGRRKLFGEKSLAGTVAFFVTATVAGSVLLALVAPALGAASALGIAAATAAAGAVAELFSGRIDDNFTVPLVAGAMAMLLL